MQRWFHGSIAVILALLMLVHVGDPQGWFWIMLSGSGVVLALSICKTDLHRWTLRILAVAATITLFVFAFGFFSRAPYLGPEWYHAAGNSRPLALLAATFCMLAVVSAYTCRMKSTYGDDSYAEPRTSP